MTAEGGRTAEGGKIAADGRIVAGGRIGRAVEGVRGYLSRSLGLMVGAWCGTVVLALLVLAPALAGGGGWNAGSPVPMLLVTLLLAVVPAGIWYWRRLGRHWCAEHRVTRSMDRTAGLDEGAVLGGLELSREAPPGTSAALRELALRRVGKRLSGDSKTLSGKLGERISARVRRGVVAFLAAVSAPLLVLGLAPSRTFSAWDGLLNPLAVLAEPTLPPVTVEPGTVEVSRGAVVEIAAHAPLRDSVTLSWDVTGQVIRSRAVVLADGVGRSSLPPADAETRYWIDAPDGARSEVHVLTPVDPLFVSTFTLEVTYPPHTGIAPGEYRNEMPALAIPAGTHLRVRGDGSRDIGAGTLLDEDGGAVVELGIQGARFEGSWVPARSGTYAWRFSDAAGGDAAAIPEPLVLEVIPDQPPRVTIVFPGVYTIMPVGLRQPLVIHAGDDYGVDRVEIVVRRITSFGEAGEPVVHAVELGGSAGAIVRPVLVLSGWNLSPGDTIRYLARAIDNHPAQHTRESVEYVLWMGGITELERAAQEELDKAAEGVEELAEEARRAEEEARDLQQRNERETDASDGSRNGQSDFEEREEIAQALERQDQMMEAVDSLRRELAELRNALKDAGLADPELANRLQELEDLLEDAAPEEGRDELAELSDQLAEMSPRELQEALEKMAMDQERLRQRLEDSLEQFRNAAIEQDFRATSQEAQELAEEQEILADAMMEGGDEALRAEQQEALEQQAENLRARLEELQQRLDEAGEQDAGAGVREARHQLSQARQQMRQAAQMAQQGQQQSAGEQAQQAAGDLSEVSRQLNQAQMQMQQEMMNAIREALGQTAADALALARSQSELRREMQGANASELAALRSDEAAIAQGIRNLAENYAEGTEMAAPGARDLLAMVGQAMEQLDGTIEAMENPRGRGPSPMAEAESVVRTLNEVAQMAMTSGQQQGQAQASASASEQMMQQLQQLAQQQGEIMQDASALTPMQLGEETMAEQVEEMSGRQEEVAEELGEMSEEGSEEGDPLGDLSALAEEARRLAEALAQGRLDPEVLRRQERLFHRLLDAGRTLERDEESEERESEEAGGFTRDGVDALTAGDLDALRFELPGAAALRALPPAQRALVVRYFERLNRGAPPATDGGGRR